MQTAKERERECVRERGEKEKIDFSFKCNFRNCRIVLKMRSNNNNNSEFGSDIQWQ